MNALQLTLYVGVETLYAGALFTHYLACKITHAKRRVSYYLQFFRKIFPNYFSGLMLGEGMIPYAKEAVEAFGATSQARGETCFSVLAGELGASAGESLGGASILSLAQDR